MSINGKKQTLKIKNVDTIGDKHRSINVFLMMEIRGLEPLTFWLPAKHSPS